jgi:hypothetical protein
LSQLTSQETTISQQVKDVEANLKNPSSKANKPSAGDSSLLDLNKSINERTLTLKSLQFELLQIKSKIEQK